MDKKTKDMIKNICYKASVDFLGITPFKGYKSYRINRLRHLIYFNDLITATTLALWFEDGFTVEKIKRHQRLSRERFKVK